MSVKIHKLRCGYITVTKNVLENGESFYMPSLFSLSLTKNRVKLPVFCFLIEKGDKKILVDTGLSRAISPDGVYDYSAGKKLIGSSLAHFYHAELPSGEAIEEQLCKLNITPEQIDYVLLTHLDLPHICNTAALKNAKHIMCSEEDYFWSCRTVYRVRNRMELFDGVKLERFWYKGSPVGTNRRSLNLLGDESITLVNLPGHCEGLFAVKIQSGKDFVILTSDTAMTPKAWQNEAVPGFGFNQTAQLKAVRWLREQSMDEHCKGLLTSHDPDMRPGTIEF